MAAGLPPPWRWPAADPVLDPPGLGPRARARGPARPKFCAWVRKILLPEPVKNLGQNFGQILGQNLGQGRPGPGLGPNFGPNLAGLGLLGPPGTQVWAPDWPKFGPNFGPGGTWGPGLGQIGTPNLGPKLGQIWGLGSPGAQVWANLGLKIGPNLGQQFGPILGSNLGQIGAWAGISGPILDPNLGQIWRGPFGLGPIWGLGPPAQLAGAMGKPGPAPRGAGAGGGKPGGEGFGWRARNPSLLKPPPSCFHCTILLKLARASFLNEILPHTPGDFLKNRGGLQRKLATLASGGGRGWPILGHFGPKIGLVARFWASGEAQNGDTFGPKSVEVREIWEFGFAKFAGK